MAIPQNWRLLPPDLLELQIGQIDLLMAMYPDEITMQESSTALLDSFRNGIEYDLTNLKNQAQDISLQQHLIIPTNDDASESVRLCVNLTLPLTYQGSETLEELPKPRVWIQQAPWLNKAAVASLTATIPLEEDLTGTIEHIRSTARQYFEDTHSTHITNASSSSQCSAAAPLIRVWFYFPSISTRAKRDDLIIHAPRYTLTGFLYAGKPGLLCVEGTSTDIDAYMRFIKTESWGDIPPGHKKVSERLREVVGSVDSADGDEGRVFMDMSEITDLGERRGARGNRGDLRALEEWLVERGLGSAFAKVLM